MYDWRKLSDIQRADLLTSRITNRVPWHGPPRLADVDGTPWFHITAACFEHRPLIGQSPERLTRFEADLFEVLEHCGAAVGAWCVLPNHYHALVQSGDIRSLARTLGMLHGRTSHGWNIEESCGGRKVFHRMADRVIRSDAHGWATLNYIHHNPIKHGYVKRWTEWPWSSATRYLEAVGQAEAARIWNTYPVLDYGKGWDD
jgi:putative transposase